MAKFNLGQQVYVLDTHKYDDIIDIKIANAKITSITERLSYGRVYVDIIVECKHEGMKVDESLVFESFEDIKKKIDDILEGFGE